MRLACICLLCAISPAVHAADPADGPSCAERLDRTLSVMQDRPLLKEEHATALMWLRMDALKADARGDDAECVAKVEVAEALLGLSDHRE